ncbi:TauD/TfdA family dioxygenase [Streptomyces sp. RKAG290]|uniref:TauD/TfdA family dioxygenase n=1 Tax=Streptomyces sp. RKAG290 TaxID=2888348 RepID=UPI0020338420|nr:TauD/TfdA family dioxygenase [Streptomyces sp. RKAG290]MCM2411694.1 TauD/TfdA family dioxygenase [Streptomyces sp. RKAG290]
MSTEILQAADRRTAPTFGELVLPDAVRDAIGAELALLPDPVADIDRAMTRYHRVFAALPLELLQQVLDFGRHIDTPGGVFVHNLPVDETLPPTPADGGPGRGKRGFVAEGVLLGLAGLIGEPIGVLTEKDGRIVHDVVPVRGGERTQTNQGSAVFLNFHSDITYDSTGRYDIANPDFLVLNCLRGDRSGAAATHYADARDICGQLTEQALEVLRSPLFRLDAPGSYTRSAAGGGQVLSDPVPIISGAAEYPEITISANGVHPLTRGAVTAFGQLQDACRAVAHTVCLEPGQALLINNRKGVHARSEFVARHDGRDRWLQRAYVRRSLWNIRYRVTPADRRVHY